MPDRPSFPIPEVIDPPKMCLQLCIPDEPTWKAVINGLLSELGQWYNWQRDDARSGKELAQVWRILYNEIDWSNMSCCCPEPVKLKTRYTDQGHYQTSNDGGFTWDDALESDPRYSSPEFPPSLPAGTIDDTCTYADSIVTIMRVQFVEAAEVGDTVTTLAALLAGIVGAILGPLSWALIYVIAAALFPAVIAFTVDAWKDAFTEELWERLLCNLKENMGTDGSFSQAQTDAVYDRLSEDETGIALFTLQRVVATFGPVGLTNAARSGTGNPEADCSECSDLCAADWVADQGTIVDIGADYIEVEAELEFGGYYATLTSPGLDPGNCCQIVDFIVTSGEITDISCLWRNCGEMTDSTGLYAAQECYVILRHSTGPFTVKFVFG